MADRIEPTEFPVRPPGGSPDHRPQGGAGWLGLLIAAVAIGGIVWWLTRPGPATPEPPEPAPEPVVAVTPSPEPPPPVEPAPAAPEPAPPAKSPGQVLLERKQAEEALTRYLAMKRDLEVLAVAEWGGDAYAAVLAGVQQADEAYSAEDFTTAAQGYDTARRASEDLRESVDEAFAGLMDGAGAALTEVDGVTAERLFAAALAIRPDDGAAATGLRRSKTIARVTALLETGDRHEGNDLLELALVDYQEAMRLDPDHPTARTAAHRVQTVLRDRSFREAMSDALGALQTGELTKARARVLQAKALRPTAPEVADALFRITEAERRVRIDALGNQAGEAEAREAWAEAHTAYREVLALDAHVAFAREGAARCATGLRLQQQIRHYVDDPGLLTAPEGRATARNLVTEFEGMGIEAPALGALADRLSRALTLAETKVPVALASDGQTRVDIYKVGRFPPFESRELELLPGTYTVVGHRPGYRDVRLQLEVTPGAEEVTATVICRERI